MTKLEYTNELYHYEFVDSEKSLKYLLKENI